MMKSGAPDKVGALCWSIEFHGFTSRNNSKGYHLVPGLISIYLEMVWVPFSLKGAYCVWGQRFGIIFQASLMNVTAFCPLRICINIIYFIN